MLQNQSPFISRFFTRRDWIKCLGVLGLSSSSIFCRAATPVWLDQRQVGSFIFRSTFLLSDSETIEVRLVDLETELRRVLSLRPCKQTIEVLLFATKEEYLSALESKYPNLSKRRALFVRQGQVATVYAYKQSDLAVDLRHECTHALLHADIPKLPLWLDEGLAEYFEPPESERASGTFHLEALLADLDRNSQLSLQQLEQENDFDSFINKDYRYAWAWVHFLLHGPKEASELLWEFLAQLRKGKAPRPMSSHLSKTIPRYETQFIAHFRNWPSIVANGKD